MSQDEFTIIERYFASIAQDSDNVVMGPGDDCAVLHVPSGHELCVTTDTLNESVHFPENCPAAVVAQRTLAANLSDLAAMGATPHSFLLAMTLPHADEDWLCEFSKVLAEGMRQYDVPLVGGNLSRGAMSLTITANGIVPVGGAITRSGAQPGDGIYVSGYIGDAGAGLERYQRDPSARDYLIERYINPTPRVELGQMLRDVATAMIDVSDGLVADLTHLCESSKAGAELELRDVPLSEEFVEALDDVKVALSSGDDYELCFTSSADDGTIERIKQESGVNLTRIGRIIENPKLDVFDNGKLIVLDQEGYLHFE